jgi:hypothetical protein
VGEDFDDTTMDACLVAAGQKLTTLAEGGLNQQAADAVRQNEADKEHKMASSKGSFVSARKR